MVNVKVQNELMTTT